MIRNKIVTLFLSACLFSAVFSGQAQARSNKQETRNPIDTVSVSVTSQVHAGDDWGYIVATEAGGLCTIGNYEWSGMSLDGWAIGDKPKVRIYLHAKNGYYFNKTNGKGKVTVAGADYSSARIADNKETLIVAVDLKPVEGKYLAPLTADWAGYPYGKAQWEPVKGVDAYGLTLYRDGERIFDVERAVGTEYDFFPHMDKPGTYMFRVRGVPKDSVQAEYLIPTDWTGSRNLQINREDTPAGWYGWNLSTEGQSHPLAGWQKNSDGWWYANPDGTYPSDNWMQINGKWYLFDYRGYMLTGWQLKNGRWYFLSVNGDMQTGWLQDERQWYYLSNDGAALTGFHTINGDTYFMNDRCAIVYGWWLLEGKWYYFDKVSGKMVKNTTIDGYYIDKAGIWAG